MMMAVSLLLFLGFVFGIISVLAVEAILILILIKRLSKETKSLANSTTLAPPPLNPLHSHQSLHSLYQKQGVVWVLEPEKVHKTPALPEQTKKKDVLEVSPIRKHAKIKDRTLFLTEPDGSHTKVLLKGCQIVAVSASSLPTRKWAKLYPIKVENKNAVLYQGSKVFYIYAETSWDKESWCKALRLASSDDKERLLWHSKLSEEFRCYLKSLSEGYPSLVKPSAGYHCGPLDKVNRNEDPPSKVRQFWRKLSKKSSFPIHDERRIVDKARVPQSPSSVSSTLKSSIPGKMVNECVEESASVSSSSSVHSGSSTHISEIYDADALEKVVDEGTLCWNLLMSRLFFDIKNNSGIKTALKARIQRTLTNMRTPSYVGEVICTDIDPGNLPPHILGMRAIPTDMNDLWALEMDIEYSGGVVLYIEARLEVGELDSHSGMVDENMESSSSGEVTTDLLEDFRHLQEALKLSDAASDSSHQLDAEDHRIDKLRDTRAAVSTSAPGSRWKAILNSVAKHVSQVPLTLAIKVATLKGTVQLHVKPPPSDQLWFGFTSMPDIHFQLESSVKDHKITSGRVASILINRFKASIRESLVLPNCESAFVSWMLAEKDDWIPRSAAPLLRRDTPSDTPTSNGDSNPESSTSKPGDRDLESKPGKPKKFESLKPVHEDRAQVVPYTAFNRSSSESSIPLDGLQTPLLQNGEVLETSGSHSPSRYVSLREESNSNEDDDGKPKKVGRRSRMLDLGKKMSEKIEEKRRHIEEKSRNIVEKMRGP
ncbi:uncharacterized protein LOC141605664 [Silene latifolia]|uniref:uncharacterized protein LOC141605664 n=1 Tax=Silene latifolia TaxID=37657 RepID=UPI003D76A84B